MIYEGVRFKENEMIKVASGVAGVEALKARGRGGEVEQRVEREGEGGAQGIEGARSLDHSLHGRKEKVAGKKRFFMSP